jgi:hypothetical protein
MTQIGFQPILKWDKSRQKATRPHSDELLQLIQKQRKKLSMIDSALESISNDYYFCVFWASTKEV